MPVQHIMPSLLGILAPLAGIVWLLAHGASQSIFLG